MKPNSDFLVLAFLFSGFLGAIASPRSPLPAVPESAPLLYRADFDYIYWFTTNRADSLATEEGTLVSSWSGYALERTATVTPFVVPALSSGHTNFTSGTAGALRIWVSPYWSSSCVTNGSGPQAYARLAELAMVGNQQPIIAWSLQASQDGSSLSLLAPTESGSEELLTAQIEWIGQTAHCITLNYGPEGTALFVDGQKVAQGGGTLAVEPPVAGLVFGSTIVGTDGFGGTIDEICSFGRPLTEEEVSFHYQANWQRAALGPVSAAEQSAREQAIADRQGETSMQLEGPSGPDGPVENGCSPGGPVYITNVLATLTTNQAATVAFEIWGGTNGVDYHLYTATNLVSALTNVSWRWVQFVHTCDAVLLTNQPQSGAYYMIAPEKDTDNDGIPDWWEVINNLDPSNSADASDDPDGDWLSNLQEYQATSNPHDTMVVAWGANFDGQCDVPLGLRGVLAVTGGDSYSLALKSEGTIVPWGDNTFGQTNLPVGLTNAMAISSGPYHTLALRSDRSVSVWGSWWNGGYHTPTVAQNLTNVVAIAAGADHDLALNADGTVTAWGYASTPYNTVPAGLTGVRAVAAGWQHSLALQSNGTVVVWGINGAGLGWNLTNMPPGLTNVTAIAAGALHSLALRNDGTVVSWGFYLNGQTNVPSGLSNVIAVAAGGSHSSALKSDGTVVVWGHFGEAGSAYVPASLNNLTAIGDAFNHNLAIRSGRLTPLILLQPVDQIGLPGINATFSALAVGLVGVAYQWQFNSVNIPGATNSTLVLTNVQATHEGVYRIVFSTGAGSIISSNATFTLIRPPQIVTITPSIGTNWISTNTTLSVTVSAAGQWLYPLSYQWKFNGTNIQLAGISSNYYIKLTSEEGDYTLTITNAAGSTNVGPWRIRVALPGMVAAWGINDAAQLERPPALTDTLAISAGDVHCVAVSDDGKAWQWGFEWSPVPAYATNLINVAAGSAHTLGLRKNGTVLAWGWNDTGQTNVPGNLSNVVVVSAGGNQSLALKADGTVVQWGATYSSIPSDLTNASTISSGADFHLAMRRDGTVIAWGKNDHGQTNVPPNLTNVVAIAARGAHALAVRDNGTVVAWGSNGSGESTVPTGLSNIMAVAAGHVHSVALRNDSTVLAWGDNTYGQLNVLSNLPPVKWISAAGSYTLEAFFAPSVQYPVDVTKDLLLIYNTNSLDSSNVWYYYMQHRPMVAGANILPIGCAPQETVNRLDFTNTIRNPALNWLNSNPTKRPEYWILFLDIPSRINETTNIAAYGFPPLDVSVSYELYSTMQNRALVTHINMNGTNDCKAYIDKLKYIGTNYSPGKLLISAGAGGYGNTNYYFDDANNFVFQDEFLVGNFARAGVLAVNPGASIAYRSGNDYSTNLSIHITNGVDVAGYISFGAHSSLVNQYALDGKVRWSGNSSWWILATVESINGLRFGFQGNFLQWYSSGAFGGTNYSSTPIGAVSHVEEPGFLGTDAGPYFGAWEAGKNFAICAWSSRITMNFQAIGDPLITK